GSGGHWVKTPGLQTHSQPCEAVCDLCFDPAITASSMRVAIRHRYNIKGSLCKDICVSCFCEWCSWCQMHRELKQRGQNSTAIVNVPPARGM
uniref:Plac8 onzin related protein 2 n=1 Tax=Monopterus albus TaxID=43700 RepID=A0A3Q3K2R8_MONAL